MEQLRLEFEEKNRRYFWLLEARHAAATMGCEALITRWTMEMVELDLRLKNLKWALDRRTN